MLICIKQHLSNMWSTIHEKLSITEAVLKKKCIPGFGIRTYQKKKKVEKIPEIFQSILCGMDKWNLILTTDVLLFDVLTILIHHFVLFFSILSQRKKFDVKRKNNTQSSYIIFFCILCRMDIYFRRLVIDQIGIKMNISNT